MAENTDDQHRETGKFYGAARKFKQRLGTTPDGTTIPGGPYTVTQFVLGISVIALGLLTRPLWGETLLQDVIYIGAATVAVVFLSGKIPSTRRNPFRMAQAVWRLLVRSRESAYRGRPASEAVPNRAWKHRAPKEKRGKPTRAERKPQGHVKKARKNRPGPPDPAPTHDPTLISAEHVQPAVHPSLGRVRADLGLVGQD